MIPLCAHCLKPLDKLIGVILPPDDEFDQAKIILLKVKRVHGLIPQGGGELELTLDVFSDDRNVTPQQVNSITNFVCPHCRESIASQVNIYDFTDDPPPGMEPDKFGKVLVAVIGHVTKPKRGAVRRAILGSFEPKIRPPGVCPRCGKPNGAD